MRLVTASEMGSMDKKAINEYGIPGVVLMENAGLRVVEVISQILGDLKGKKVVIFAGKGNNGGDGFVVARHLHNLGSEVQVFLAAEPEHIKGDAAVNLNIWQRMGQKIYSLTKNYNINSVRLALMNADLLVDALYGTGFKGTLREQIVPFVEAINNSSKPVVSIDIPSGLEADTGRANGPCVIASHTVTFALPKLGLVLPDARPFVGELHVVDISIPESVTYGGDIKRFYITNTLVNDWLPRHSGMEHKGTYGRVLTIAGSRGMSGAAVLAAQAAARAGAGLVTLGVPAGIHDITEVKLTEAMTFPLPQTDEGLLSRSAIDPILERARKSDVLALGPGIGSNADIAELVKKVLLEINIPCVLDADGLNMMVGKTELFKLVKSNLILTPHPGEMARLTGKTIQQIQKERLKITIKKATEWQSVLVLKGAGTVIAGPDETLLINGTGNPGMATGGTGDVLTGLIAGLVAQGVQPLHAAAAGVYLHGVAGDIAAKNLGMAGMLAGDLLDQIPAAMKNLA